MIDWGQVLTWEGSIALVGLMLITATFVIRSGSRLATLLQERRRELWLNLGKPVIRWGPRGAGAGKLHELAFGRLVASETDPDVVVSRRATRVWLVVHDVATLLFLVHFALSWMA